MMILSVGIGGACGAILRYLTSVILTSHFAQDAWVATLIVNLAGCLIMGICSGIILGLSADAPVLSPYFRSFMMVGFLGALTTFSSFALDFHQLFLRYNIAAAALYLALSVFCSVLVFYAGLWLIRQVLTEA